MSRFSDLGNDLYSGRRSINFVGRLRTWLVISAVLFAIAVSGLSLRQLNLGIEFTGGSDYRVARVNDMANYEARAKSVITQTGQVSTASITKVGGDAVRITTERFDDAKAQSVRTALAKEFKVSADEVQFSVIGPSWGASVSQKALQALIWFLALVALLLALYFRSWKMSLAALVALLHDIFITVGIYSLAGLEVTPALVRSINTTVVALLPVGSLLLVGLLVLGPGTLLDLSVALFIGIAVGAYSSIFVATPLYAYLREREPEMRSLRKRVEKSRAKAASAMDRASVGVGTGSTSSGAGYPPGVETTLAGDTPTGAASSTDATDATAIPVSNADRLPTGDSTYTDQDGIERTVTGRLVHPYAKRGPRNQPKKPPRSKR